MEYNTKLLGIIPVYDTEDFLNTKYNFDLNETISACEEDIIINNSQDEAIIQYKKITDDGYFIWERVDGSDSPIRPARMSDLDNFLRENDWNIGMGRKIVKQIDNEDSPRLYLYSEETYGDEILKVDDIDQQTMSPKYSVISDSYISSYNTAIKATVDLFNSHYENLMNIKPMNYIYDQSNESSVNLGSIYYYNLISSRNLESGSTIIDLLSLNDSNYTNILNLIELVPQNNNNEFIDCKCLLTLGVDCSIDGKLFSREVSFVPFNIDKKEGLKSLDSIIDVLDLATIDYHDFCLRVFPKSIDINECIISYCYITYDKL